MALEVGARFFVSLPSPYPTQDPLLVFDMRGFWTLRPNARQLMDNGIDFRARPLTIGTDGTRRVPCRASGHDDARKIIALGDSQTFGFGLADDETWPNRLQCLLSRSGSDARVYNFGVPGTNLAQYLMRGGHFLDALRPGDDVMLAITWNDLHTDQAKFVAGKMAPRHCPDRARTGQSEPFALCLARPLRFYQPGRTWRKSLYRRSSIFVPRFDSLKSFLDSAIFTSALAFILLPRLRLAYYAFRDKSTLHRKIAATAFEANMRIAARIHDLVAARGARTMVLLLPNRLFFDDYYYAAYSKSGVVFPERDYPYYVTRSACRTYMLDCFSLFEALRTTLRDRHSFAFDGHYNSTGAEAIAGALSARLRRTGSPPAR
jgi:hypothetical protein